MSDEVKNFVVITIAYIMAFAMTSAIITPLQNYLLSSIPNTISILFLPHGVRVLAAHYFGWRSIFYLLPSSYFLYFLLTQAQGLDIHPVAPLLSILATYIGIKTISFIANITPSDLSLSTWKWLLLGGFLASLLNGLAHGLLQSKFSLTSQILGYAIGDVAGQFALMIGLIYYFRYFQTAD